MCGIAGVLDPNSTSGLGRLPEKMAEALHHRGPDDQGFFVFRDGRGALSDQWQNEWRGQGLFLVHRRLSILELTRSGWQPMASPDGRYHIVFNGEIYNDQPLKQELEALGHKFQSRSDTEVLLHAYMQWGERALSRCVGMFAFAIFDRQTEQLFLARDPFGIKPLFYSSSSGRFAFASEIPCLLECPWIDRLVDSQAAYRYLRHGLSGMDETVIFRSIRQLPAAHFMRVSLSGQVITEPQRYWRPNLERPQSLSFQEATEHLRELFLKSVRLHMRSDVPVGAALSGGIDSSAVAAAMRHVSPSSTLETFSFVAKEPSMDEERYMDLVQNQIGAHPNKVQPRAEDILVDLPHIIQRQGEPFPGTSIYAQYRVFKLAHSRGIKVLLDGQGADEYLGGYRFYLSARLASLMRQNRWQEGLRFLNRCSRLPGVGRLGLLFRAADFMLPPKFQGFARKMIGKETFPSWLDGDWFKRSGVQPEPLFYTKEPDVLRQTLLRTLEATSLPHLLRYEDRNSMAFSVESRVPFLTTELVEFCLNLPEEHILGREGISKHVFREAMRGLVPDQVLDRRDKIGFQTPERAWMSDIQEWIGGSLESAELDKIPMFNRPQILNEWRMIKSGQKPPHEQLWRWVSFIEWSRQFQAEFPESPMPL